MLLATPNEGQYSGNTLNVDLGGGGKHIYICPILIDSLLYIEDHGIPKYDATQPLVSVLELQKKAASSGPRP